MMRIGEYEDMKHKAEIPSSFSPSLLFSSWAVSPVYFYCLSLNLIYRQFRSFARSSSRPF